MHIVIDARIRRSSTGRYADRLVEHLQAIDKDNSYTVLIEPDDPWQPSADNFKAVPCRFKQFSFNPLDQITFSKQLYGLKADLTHFTMTQQPIFYFGKIVTTTHDLTMLRYTRPGKLPGWLHAVRMAAYRFLVWCSHRKSHRIIVATNYVAEDLARLHPFTRDKTGVTYEASEPPLIQKPVKPKGISPPFILYVGTAFPHKNLDNLVDAFEILKTSYPSLSLVMAGKKEHYYKQLERYVSVSSAKDSIFLPGFVSDAELKWLYQNAAAYVFPSFSEGFGLPALEAMAHGCPVASSNATCLPEVYGDAAIYFAPNDINDIAAKVSKILDDKHLRSDLINRGYEQAGKYSWRRMAQKTLEIYKEVAGQKRR